MHEKILVPLDGSKLGEAALPYVEALVSKMLPEVEIEITLLQVLTSSAVSPFGGETSAPVDYTGEEMEQMKNGALAYLDKTGQALSDKGYTASSAIAIGDASEEIVRVSEEIEADLIAIATHGRSGLSRWAFGSVAEKVLRRGGRVPIVMVRVNR
jgi:nucleotide-binding universal stress UspA family protein